MGQTGMRKELVIETSDRESEPDDLALLRGVAAGDEASFRLLFRRWAPRLGRFLRGAAGSREAGEDLLQETFLRILKAAPAFEQRGSVAGWFYRIASNLAYSHWRKERARPASADPEEKLALLAAPVSSDPARAREAGALRTSVSRALERMPANHRVVFLLKIDQGLTYERIAEIMQCPIGTAKSRFHFAVRRLRADLEDYAERGAADGGSDGVMR